MPAKNVLITYGGWNGHQPKETATRFADFLKGQGWNVTLTDSLDCYLDAGLMAAQDLIVNNWTCGTLSNDQWKGLDAAIKAGCGFAGWHGGVIDAFRGNIDFQWLVGAQFLSHPGNIKPYDVVIDAWEDPIFAGLDHFTVNTEQYYMMVDPGVTVLAHTMFTGAEIPHLRDVRMPVVWKRRWGLGKVFISALGHVDSDFQEPSTRTIMERGLLWAAR